MITVSSSFIHSFTHSSIHSSDNQQFLKEIITNVLEGQGVGWLKLNRVKKLMEDENYRNFVVSRLNISLERKLTDEDLHLEDVVRWEILIYIKLCCYILSILGVVSNQWCSQFIYFVPNFELPGIYMFLDTL